ncbi:hypothetical protein [Pseudomonas putida]
MRIEFDLNLDPAEIAEIGQIIGTAPANVPNALAGYGKSALQEYLAMMRGQKALNRGSEIREYRLVLLIENVFHGIPDEQILSKIFQTTPSGSGALLRSVLSKHQYQLRAPFEQTLKLILERATAETITGPYLVTMDSVSMIEQMNRKLAGIDGTLASVSKKRGSVSTYEITKSSYEQLCTELGATPAVYVP